MGHKQVDDEFEECSDWDDSRGTVIAYSTERPEALIILEISGYDGYGTLFLRRGKVEELVKYLQEALDGRCKP